MFKKTALILFCTLALSGCRNADDAVALAKTLGKLVGLAAKDADKPLHQQTAPKAADFPLRLPAGWQQIASLNSETYTSSIAFTPTKKKAVYYFGSDGKIASAPNTEGYYREWLGTTADGKRVVQDFYQSSQTPQTTPFVLENDANIESFDSDVSNGRIVWFTRGGDVAQIGDFAKGEWSNALVSIRHGKAVLAVEKTREGMAFYTLDDNAKISAIVAEQGNATRTTLFYPNGSAMFQGDIAAGADKLHTAYCWNEAAQPIDCDSIQDKLEASSLHTDDVIKSATSI